MGIKHFTCVSVLLLTLDIMDAVLANDFIIDDRSRDDLVSNLGTEWRLITDRVMGGVSSGQLTLDTIMERKCLRMQGEVSTDNNGGFVQIALPMSDGGKFDASAYAGVEIEVTGNNEYYNIHFRTSSLWLPWQSYRASFEATPVWQTIRIPFQELEAYRTTQAFRPDKLERIGLVGIGRNFQADLCLASMRFYSAN